MIRKTIFPFNFVPTIIEVTANNVVVTFGQLLGSRQTEVIPIKDIHTVESDSNLVFGELVITHGMPGLQLKIPYLRIDDARDLEVEIQKMIGNN